MFVKILQFNFFILKVARFLNVLSVILETTRLFSSKLKLFRYNKKLHLVYFAFLLFFYSSNVFSQSQSDSINITILNNAFSGYFYQTPSPRKILSTKNKNVIYKINPVTYLFAGALFFYQRVISGQLQANCIYEISCSEYTKKCIEYYGFVKGTLLGIHQLNNCIPNACQDHCSYKLSTELKIVNHIEEDQN